MPRYRISHEARRDLKAIDAYITSYDPAAAMRMQDAFRTKFRMLSRQPLIGEACPEGRPGLRFFVLGSYVVYYRPTSGGVRVERVLHGARDQRRALGTDDDIADT